MFDVGFWEILLILVLALVVIGPERLPGAARKAGFFVGKARRYIEGVRSEVESELDINEFKRMLHNQEVQINELQQQLKTGADDIKSGIQSDIKTDIQSDLPDEFSVTEALGDSPTHSFHGDLFADAEAEDLAAKDSVAPGSSIPGSVAPSSERGQSKLGESKPEAVKNTADESAEKQSQSTADKD